MSMNNPELIPPAECDHELDADGVEFVDSNVILVECQHCDMRVRFQADEGDWMDG